MRKLTAWAWLAVWTLTAGMAGADTIPRALRSAAPDVYLSDLNVSSSDSPKSWWYSWLVTLAKPLHDIRDLKRQLQFEWRPRLGRDPIELAGLPEGDVLPPPQVAITKKSGAQDKNAVSETMRLWPDGVVPYQFSSAFLFLPLERYLIQQVMADIGRHSCARFVERTHETDFLKIVYDRDKCYSHIGRVGGPQPLSLGFFCVRWWDQGTIYHELLHSLGFFHEHNRPDRDNYVEILWDNISSGQDKNFRKRSYSTVELIDLPYDFDSVMHYNPYAFSKWYFLAPTIKSRAKGARFKRAKKPTTSDYNKLNRLYRCQRTGRFHYSYLDDPGPSPRWFHENGFNVSAVVPPPPPRDASRRRVRAGSERLPVRAARRSTTVRFPGPAPDAGIQGLTSHPWFKNRILTPVAPFRTPGKGFGVPASAPVFRDPGPEFNGTATSYTKNSTLLLAGKPWTPESVENPHLLIIETRGLANEKNNTAPPKETAAPSIQVKPPVPALKGMPNPALTPLGLTRQQPQKLNDRTESRA
ncbi:astacin-like metalloendopeptidase isoform X1 [Penaeus indicus]|uniref:astacin-like metalloendopeptidase isoform X1 n=1 Tax=Penaeus indicus TaxID=29960 RepID=UPI00300CD298